MTITEAHQFTMDKVIELENAGIKVNIKPSRGREIESTVKKYGDNPECVPINLWYHVTFVAENEAEKMKVHNAVNYLGMCGITFDTGGCCNQRDWELDWSFRYEKGEEDMERRDARDMVEDIINRIDS